MADEDTTSKDDKSTAEPKPAVTFRSDGEFMAVVTKKAKPMIAEAVNALRSEIAGKLGIESLDDIESLGERLKTTEKTVGEMDKLRAQHDKVSKEYAKELKRSGDLTQKLVKIAKRDALLPFAAQVRDPEALAMFAEQHLEVDHEEGTVSVKDGRKLDDLVSDILKAKDYLKAPGHKDGAGTTANEPRKANDGKGNEAKTDAATATNGAEVTYKTFGEAVMADLKARGALPNVRNP